MKPFHRLLAFGLALLAVAWQPVLAEDIDIFTAAPPSSPASAANVLILVDNSTNWTATFGNTPGDCASTDPTPQNKTNNKYCHVMGALKSVIGGLGANVKVGLMLFNDAGDNGGYMRFGVRPMNPTNKTALIGLIDNLRALSSGSGGDRDGTGSNQPYGRAMFEVFKYFGGYSSPAAVSASACGGSPCAGSPVSSTRFGPAVFAGHSGATGGADKRDWPGNTGINNATGVAVNSAATRGAEPAGSAYASPTATSYTSPISDGCQKNYVIVISSGNASVGGDSQNPNASVLLGNVGGNTATINPPNHANLADEWARFLYATDVSPLAGQQNIITYTVMVWDPQPNGQPSTSDATGIGLLKSMANQGRGRYFDANNPAALGKGLATIFNEVQAVNSVFASVALPVSVNVRGTNLNQVYLGVFRPDAAALPRWPGNLKEYQLDVDTATGTLFLADRRNVRADNQTSGFIVDDAISFWTTPSPAPPPNPASGFWSFRSNNIGNPPSGHDSPDGAVVEKGAVSQRLHALFPSSQAGRKLFTCLGCAPGTNLAGFGPSTLFDSANAGITPARVGAASAAERDAVIAWVRGADNTSPPENSAPPAGQTIRPTVHGDVLHSRPAVINYNRVANSEDDVVVFYGANDGLFRAVKGGKDIVPGPGSDVGGNEKWAFVAEEFLDGFKRLRDNTPTVGASAPSAPKKYFFDGPIGVYQKDANGDLKLDTAADPNDKVQLFIAMRRGGRMVYALDVSNPDAPVFLWKKGCPSLASNAGCDPGWSEIGQTWSEPKVVSIRATSNPVLVFGAGYDPSVEDQDPVLALSANPMGRGIFVVDATNGNVIWQAGPNPTGSNALSNMTAATVFNTVNKSVTAMTFSIPSDVAALPVRSSGNRRLVDRLYVGDTGGNIWRVDLSDPDPNNWAVNKLASIGAAASPGAPAARRKFLFSVDVVYSKDSSDYDAVTVGSGDREHPFNTEVVNRYYMFKDRSTGTTFTGAGSGTGANSGAIVESDLYDTTQDLIQVGTPAERAAAAASLAAAKGWYITLAAGEKVVTSSTSVAGIVSFNTNRPTPPAPNSCTSNLGEARLYAVDYRTGAAVIGDGSLTVADRYTLQAGGGYPPSPVPVVVQLNGKKYEAVISGTTVRNLPTPKLEARYRTYWYKEMERPRK
ncbi:MAG: pilus assembly protein [Betaproteobacteria bacterium]